MLTCLLINKLESYDEIIFDLDNTLFAQQDYDMGAFEDIENELKKKTQSKLTNFSRFLSLHKQKMGNDYGFLFNDTLAQYHLPESYLKVMLAMYYHHDGRYIKTDKSLIPKISSAFNDKKMFVVTNGPTKVQQTKIAKLELDLFATDIIICDPKAPEALKPKRYAFDLLNQKHHLVKPVMVGDSFATDGLFAKNVNIPFIHFTYDTSTNENN